MKKIAIFGAVILAGLIVFQRKSKASTVSLIENAKSIHIIGDSQVKRHIGDAYAEILPTKQVSFFGKEGATHKTFIENSKLLKEGLQCADLTIIQLGDNGVSADLDSIETFIALIQEQCPDTKVVWSGPMMAVKPSIRSKYVVMDDPSSSRYIHKYNNMRNVWNERLFSKLSDLGIPFIDNFNAHLQDIENLDENRGGDGVHLTEDSAYAQVQYLISKIRGLT